MSATRRSVSPERDDRGAALLTVIMLMFVVGGLGTLVAGAVVSQVRPTAATQDSTRTVFAAEAGLQSALAQLRSATATSGGTTAGDRSALPCTVTGSASGQAGAAAYSVRVDYYTTDPAGRDDAWLDAYDAGNPAHLRCTAGSGTPKTPAFAVLRSSGAAPTGSQLVRGRELRAQYAFQLTNQNTAGGLLSTVTGRYCLEAASATAGAGVSYRAAASCASGGARQLWVYDTGYHLVLASTLTSTTTGSGASATTTTSGLCLTQDAGGSGAVALAGCTRDSRTWNQLWSYEAGSRFRGQNTANTDYGTACLWAGTTGSALDGRALVAGPGGCSASYAEWGSWSPEPRVGAGAASLATRQVVSYQEFGRCMDVTSEDVTYAFMILYPCKQDPSSTGKLDWNHRFFYTDTEPVGPAGAATTVKVYKDRRTDATSTYCLTAPAASAADAYVVLKGCTGAADQQFVRTADTGTYATSYLLRTSDGRCVSVGPRRQVTGTSWSTLVAAACTGGPEQKWNAAPDTRVARVSGTQELTAGRP